MVGCGVYAIFLILFYLGALAVVPRNVRKAPAMPREFAKASLGKISEETREFLETFDAKEERKTGADLHQLYRITEGFTNGVWICEVEILRDSIVALRWVFESSISQLFDTGKQVGSGIIICTGSIGG